jgi:UPF0042 nucleotide-binding protein
MARAAKKSRPELIIITGMSGAGKATVLKVFEDLGYYAVDNLPIDLVPKFAELVRDSATIHRAAIVIDIREGEGLSRFPETVNRIGRSVTTYLIYLEADNETLVRRFSETRRPHPLGIEQSVHESLVSERKKLAIIRALKPLCIDTSRFTVHDVRDFIREKFHGESETSKILVYITSFGYRHGVPADSDLVFDVRFLPNPNYIPKFKKLTGRNPGVARYIRSFPQTKEFIDRISELLIYLLPHYIREGKSYLTIAFGCTGGHHRSVMIADQIRKSLAQAGFHTKIAHRDILKTV